MANTLVPSTQLSTAVLFLVFNRPDTTAQVFEAIRKARPPRLYVAADGPREGRDGELERVAKVREIVTNIDWPCEVKTLFREKNLGCKAAVSGAITWFFDQEEEGIILEDDCLPHEDFFSFCETLLDRYRDDERISVITGTNYQDGNWRGDGSYYFSRYNHVWGWASWRRAWTFYDGELNFWPTWKHSTDWRGKLTDRVERKYWERIFNLMHEKQIDTWDYPWTASVWYRGGLTVTPNANLVSNIGFGADSTHTASTRSALAQMPTGKLEVTKHAKVVVRDEVADKYTFNHNFKGRWRRFPACVVTTPYVLLKDFMRKIR